MFEKILVNIIIPRKNPFVKFILALVLFIFTASFLLVLIVLREGVLGWDIRLAKGLQELSFLTTAMILVSFFGDLYGATFIFSLALGFLYLKGYKRETLFMPAILVSPIINSLIKEIVSRPRPSQALVNVFEPLSEYSFPSGHVMYYVVFFGFLAFLALSLPKLKPGWRAFWLFVSLPLIFLIGASRIYLGAHWPSDVLAGYFFGGLYLLTLVLIYMKYIYRLSDVRDK